MEEAFPIRKIDFQFCDPGDVGELGPVGGDRPLSGEGMEPFLSDTVAIMGAGDTRKGGSVGDVDDGEEKDYVRWSLLRVRARAVGYFTLPPSAVEAHMQLPFPDREELTKPLSPIRAPLPLSSLFLFILLGRARPICYIFF